MKNNNFTYVELLLKNFSFLQCTGPEIIYPKHLLKNSTLLQTKKICKKNKYFIYPQLKRS